MIRPLRRAALAAFLMVVASAMALGMAPTRKFSEIRGAQPLQTLVPSHFGGWTVDPGAMSGVVNPESETLSNRIYTDVLSRVYMDDKGNRIMLSIAYGADQRGDLQLHDPEVCYPAQGFNILWKKQEVVRIGGQDMRVRRMSTLQGMSRHEYVSYWILVGDRLISTGTQRRLAELSYGVRGVVADGILFRVSSIGADPQQGFDLQDRFSSALAGALDPQSKVRLFGRQTEPS